MFGIRCISLWAIHLLCLGCLANAAFQLLMTHAQDCCGSVVSVERLVAPAVATYSDTAVEANCQRVQAASSDTKQVVRACQRLADCQAGCVACRGLAEDYRTFKNSSLFVLGTGLRL